MHRWRLPKAAKVTFLVSRKASEYGSYTEYVSGYKHEISVSSVKVKSVGMLVETMAHEMIHLRQQIAGTKRDEDGHLGHGADFKRFEAQVCKGLGIKNV